MMTIDDNHKSLISFVCENLLCDLNFSVKKSYQIVRKSNNNLENMLIIGLSKIGKSSKIGYIHIQFYITYRDIELLSSKLRGTEYSKYSSTTGHQLFDYFIKEANPFCSNQIPFTNTTDIKILGEMIINYINDYAIKFWNDFDTMEKLTKGYEQSDARLLNSSKAQYTDQSYLWKWLAAYILLGNHKGSNKLLDFLPKNDRENAEKYVFGDAAPRYIPESLFYMEKVILVLDPTTADIKRELTKLNGISNSYAVLEFSDDESYMQVGGGGVEYIVEARIITEDNEYRHYQAITNNKCDGDINIKTIIISMNQVEVNNSQVLSFEVVERLFVVFRESRQLSKEVLWKDVTDTFR
jgi:hypothetical protein